MFKVTLIKSNRKLKTVQVSKNVSVTRNYLKYTFKSVLTKSNRQLTN